MGTTPRPPALTLHCPDGHLVTTRARGGQSIRCPDCRRPVWVPTDRPRTDAERPGGGPDRGALPDLWTQPPGTLTAAPVAVDGEECTACGAAVLPTPRRTLGGCAAGCSTRQPLRRTTAARADRDAPTGRARDGVDHAAAYRRETEWCGRREWQAVQFEDTARNLTETAEKAGKFGNPESRPYLLALAAVLRRGADDARGASTPAELQRITEVQRDYTQQAGTFIRQYGEQTVELACTAYDEQAATQYHSQQVAIAEREEQEAREAHEQNMEFLRSIGENIRRSLAPSAPGRKGARPLSPPHAGEDARDAVRSMMRVQEKQYQEWRQHVMNEGRIIPGQ